MQRMSPRSRRPAHLISPARLAQFAAAALVVGLAPSLVAAQSMGGPLPYDPVDPWAGVTVIVTPTEPPEGAGPATASPAPPPRPAEAPAPPEPQIADTPIEQWTPPSLYESIELGVGEWPDPVPEEPAPNRQLPPRRSVAAPSTPQVPTSVQLLDHGPASVGVSTSLSANAPVSSLTNRQAGGGSGEVKGRVGYSMDHLSLYGTGQFGASASTGPASVYEGYSVGSSYSVPLGLGAGETLGATVEMNNASTVNTGVELRAPMGSYERFLSLQRSAPVDSTASGVVKAGVLGRF